MMGEVTGRAELSVPLEKAVISVELTSQGKLALAAGYGKLHGIDAYDAAQEKADEAHRSGNRYSFILEEFLAIFNIGATTALEHNDTKKELFTAGGDTLVSVRLTGAGKSYLRLFAEQSHRPYLNPDNRHGDNFEFSLYELSAIFGDAILQHLKYPSLKREEIFQDHAVKLCLSATPAHL